MNFITINSCSVNLLRLFMCLIPIASMFEACGYNKLEAEELPSNLKVNVQIVGASPSLPYGDGSGSVNISVSASNATSYLVQTEGQYLVIEDKNGGTINQIYSSNYGNQTYTVTVSAYNGSEHKDTTLQINVCYNPAYKLVWSDEFEGTTLNTNYWSVETGIHVNNELQNYTASGNYAIQDGVLTITCKKEKTADKGIQYNYTSARLNTYGKKSFKYGRIEARLKLPKGKGTWPAFWMLGNNINQGTGWPTCGEVDIMEYVGVDPLWVQGSLHSHDYYGSNPKSGRYQLSSNNDEAEWHVYGVIWDEKKIAFYVDDYTKPYYTYTAPTLKTLNNWPYDNDFFVILNFAFGGNWGGYNGIDSTLDNMIYQVDWVRYYVR